MVKLAARYRIFLLSRSSNVTFCFASLLLSDCCGRSQLAGDEQFFVFSRYTLKPAFKSSFVPGVERVLMIPEVRHAQPKIAKMTTKKWLM